MTIIAALPCSTRLAVLEFDLSAVSSVPRLADVVARRRAISKYDYMTRPSQEQFDALDQQVLQFMGAFASAQFAIDTVIGIYLRRKMRHLGPVLVREVLDRLQDEQRRKLFRAFAAEVGYNGDLAHFGTIYNRAKQLRDMVGHSLKVMGPVHSAGKPPSVAVTHTLTSKTNLVPNPLLPSTFTRMTADCEWVAQHAWRSGYVAEPQAFIDAAGTPYEPPTPAMLPVGGEPF
jgi:hypothetical protein